MSLRVQVLPAALADQIAAGEVVERPSSVVKELVENALDAGAGRIEVEIAGGGKLLVRVTDDGDGMNAEDARLALMRHATSKLRVFEELAELRTMGFRGEALPSIAAVSRMTVTTRTSDSIEAYQVSVAGGDAGPGRPAGAPRGTQVEVRDLFWNVPARLKFLKAEATETAHIVDTVIRLALAHPEVHFRLRVDSSPRPTIDLPPHRSALERATAALSRRGPVHLHPAAGSESGVGVIACLGSPADSANTARNTYLFVNRRLLRDRALLQSLLLGYGELLDRGRYPMAVVHLEVPPASVDVNVHPAKTEVRFARPKEVQDALRHVVRTACAKAPWLDAPASSGIKVYSLPPESPSRAREPGWSDSARIDEALRLFDPRPPPRFSSSAPGGYGQSFYGQSTPADPTGDDGTPDAAPIVSPRNEAQTEDGRSPDAGRRATEGWDQSSGADAAAATRNSAGMPGDAARHAGGFFASLRYLGQAHLTYLVCQGPDELVLIDQHAAHERVAFERLRLAHASRAVRTQRLLFPHLLDLDEAQVAAVAEHGPVLHDLGFEIDALSGRSFAVKAIPEPLAETAIDEVLLDILAELGARGASEAVAQRLDHVFATMACHSVVRAGDVLDERRVRALLDAMDGIDFRAHCPHGRPVLLRMSVAELERRFGRT